MLSEKLTSLSFQNSRVVSNVIYIVSGMPVAKLNQIIPCFSIKWKSKGSLFIKHLTFDFVLELNCNSWQINFVFN